MAILEKDTVDICWKVSGDDCETVPNGAKAFGPWKCRLEA